MSSIVWDPAVDQPANAEALEAAIREAAPGAQVKLTLRGDSSGRDLSARVAAVLNDLECPARSR